MTNETLAPASEVLNPVNQGFQVWEDRLTQLAAEASLISESGNLPQWWYDGMHTSYNLANDIRNDLPSPEAVANYLTMFTQQEEIISSATGREMFCTPFENIAGRFGEEYLGQVIKAEPIDGPLHSALIESIEESVTKDLGILTSELEILKSIYGTADFTKLLAVKGDEFSNTVNNLLRTEKAITWISYQDNPHDYDRLWKDNQEASRVWMSKAVSAAAGIPEDEAANYIFTASRGANSHDVLPIISKFDHFGADRIRNISQATNIHGLEGYSIAQLELMEDFANHPEQVAANLKDHDVSVVLINRFGDHNGIFNQTANNIDDDSRRTLFFEITKMDDIYKSMVALRKAGIKPSTLILGAHSAPGQFMVSDDRERNAKRRDIATISGKNLVRLVTEQNDMNDGDAGFSMHGMAGMARLVDVYMQPSRAIDDSKEDEGRKKIIFVACDAATVETAKDMTDEGEKFEIGAVSVVSQLGTDLAQSGIDSKIDIYGAAEGIQIKRNAVGLIYTGQPNNYGDNRIPIKAVRIRVEAGQTSSEQVDEIALRN